MTAVAMDIQTYNERRATLIAQDRSLRIDSKRAANYTTLEKKADEFIRRIRAAEAETIWGVEHEDILTRGRH